ncbi:MAG: 2-hydroxyacid dehydrogenase [Candidatus Omnitrophica bacterium]|nr:2-hydroxyacid dehydrogenase [Candidatus Omnitrophota bacterium]MDD5670138.1 2-hydroxyacid dehydrogenase [Candidatus Omnitrophota bacterium]
MDGESKGKIVKVAFFDAKPYDRESFDRSNREFGFQIVYFANHLSPQTVSLAKGYDAVCAFVNDTVDSAVIDSLVQNGVRLIAIRAAGYNNVDFKAAFQKIHVVRVPAYSPYSVAEHAVALMLSLNRKIHKAYYRTRDMNFSINGLLGFDMHGKTVGVIGTGQIGKVAIKILSGFGTRILAYDVYPDEKYRSEIGFQYADLNTIYRESDILTLHCPLNKSTYHLIDETSIAGMKDGVMLINTGRGGLIDSKALIHGLKSGKIGAAGLDVYEEESDYFFEDFSSTVMTDDVLARLLSFNNVLVTSHQAFFTKEGLHNIAKTTMNNIKDFFDGNKLENEICYRCSTNACIKKETGKCF